MIKITKQMFCAMFSDLKYCQKTKIIFILKQRKTEGLTWEESGNQCLVV